MWKTWVGDNDTCMDCQAQISIAAIDIDKDSWPITCVLVRSGIIVKCVQVLDSVDDPIPNMQGWSIYDLANWINAYEGPRPGTLRVIKFKKEA